MIWMVLLILLIGVQIKTSLKETPKQGSISLWIVFGLILIQTAIQSVNQGETFNYYSGFDVIFNFFTEAKLYTFTLMILGFIHCICRIKIMTKQNNH